MGAGCHVCVLVAAALTAAKAEQELAQDPTFGDLTCDSEPDAKLACKEQSITFVEGAVYGCEAHWEFSSEQVLADSRFQESFNRQLGNETCGSDFHICHSAMEARKLGLSAEVCRNVPPPGSLFLSAEALLPEDSPQRLSGLLGCGRDATGSTEAEEGSLPSSVFNKLLKAREDGAWGVAEGVPQKLLERATEWRLYRVRKRQVEGSGGLLCCRGPRWSTIRDLLSEYISVPDLPVRIFSIVGAVEKAEFNTGPTSCLTGKLCFALLHALLQCEWRGPDAKLAEHLLTTGLVGWGMNVISWSRVRASGWPLFALLARLQRCAGEHISHAAEICSAARIPGFKPLSDSDMICQCSTSSGDHRSDDVDFKLPDIRVDPCSAQRALHTAFEYNTRLPPETVVLQFKSFIGQVGYAAAFDYKKGESAFDFMQWLLGPLWDPRASSVAAAVASTAGIGFATWLLLLMDSLRPEAEELADAVLERAQRYIDASPHVWSGGIRVEVVLGARGCWPLFAAADRVMQKLRLCVSLGRPSSGKPICKAPWSPAQENMALGAEDAKSTTHNGEKLPNGIWFQLAPGRDISSDGMRTYSHVGGVCPPPVLLSIAQLREYASSRKTTVVEIGAATGGCGILARVLLGVRLHALLVEPNPDQVAMMKATLRLNGWHSSAIEVMQVAAGEAPGLAKLYIPPSGAAMSTLEQGFATNERGILPRTLEVTMEPLDDIISNWHSAASMKQVNDTCTLARGMLNLLIINTQGSELRTLRGGCRLLACNLVQTVVVMVYDFNDADGLDRNQRQFKVAQLLKQRGYHVSYARNVMEQYASNFVVGRLDANGGHIGLESALALVNTWTGRLASLNDSAT